MNKFLTITILFLLSQSSFGQVENNFPTHELTIDFGSFRNNYLYPITDIKYSSAVLQKVNLQFSARLRSYGTLYFFSKSSYDFTPIIEYYFNKINKPVYFSSGIGIDSRIRLVNDDRSEAKTSLEPIINFAIHGTYQKITFKVPSWLRFYSNGISFTLLPEASYKVGKKVSIFLRYELSYLTIYKVSTYEWRQDNFIGVQINF